MVSGLGWSECYIISLSKKGTSKTQGQRNLSIFCGLTVDDSWTFLPGWGRQSPSRWLGPGRPHLAISVTAPSLQDCRACNRRLVHTSCQYKCTANLIWIWRHNSVLAAIFACTTQPTANFVANLSTFVLHSHEEWTGLNSTFCVFFWFQIFDHGIGIIKLHIIWCFISHAFWKFGPSSKITNWSVF